MKTAREIKHEIRNLEQIIAFGQFLAAEKVKAAQKKKAELEAELKALESEAL